MAVITINDYNSQAPRVFSRQCPNFALPWAGMATSYDLSIQSRSEKSRRLAFVLIQTVHLVYLVLTTSLPTSPFAIPYLLASILFFFFFAWNLHLIVKMEGDRVVLGRRFGRRAFDRFLWGCVVAYAGVVVLRIVVGRLWRTGEAWLVLDLTVFVVAWVSTWKEGGVILGQCRG